jgi:tetratricopeptide (TPR) repeat protein
MNQEEFPQDELRAIVERFQEAKKEGRILYLDMEQYEEIVNFFICKNDNKSAVEAIEMGTKVHPDNKKLIAVLVAMFLDEGEVGKARETINKVLDDKSFHVRVIHAELLFVEGKKEEALKLIDSFIDEEHDESESIDIGVLCSDFEVYDKAIYWLNRSLEIDPEDEDALVAICDCYVHTKQYDAAIPLYNKLIDKNPYSSHYWSGLALSHFYMGRFDKAIEACDFALVIDDQIGEAYAIKGHSYYQLENFQESVNAYAKAFELGCSEAERIPLFIAFGFIGMENWDKAYDFIKTALTCTEESLPIYPDLLVNLARCQFHRKENAEGHRTLESVQKRFPHHVLAYTYNIKYYLEEGDRKNAIKNLNKAIAINPSAETWYQIGLLSMEGNEFELARNAFEHVKEIDSNYKNVKDNLTYVMNKLHDGMSIALDRGMLKKYLRNIVAEGKTRPERLNIDEYVRQAEKEGKSEKEIEDLIVVLDQLNDLLENFDIDQEEDETN